MARKNQRKLLDAAKKHQDALQAAGLSVAVIEKYENALKGVDAGGKISPAATVLVKDLQKEIDEFQAAMRKEFPGNSSFQAIFKANEPMPQEARDVLTVGRTIAKEAPDFAQNLIKYAINAASVKHLTYLSDQLEKELGGADPAQDAKMLEDQIVAAAKKAFDGKLELAQFEAK